MKKLFRPLGLSMVTLTCFIAWCWLLMSGMDYYEGAPWYGYRTAGWFVIGMPFLLIFGLIGTAILALITRCTHSAVGWAMTTTVFGVCISQTFISTLPAPRLATLLSLEPSDLQIVRLIQTDSFSDGITTSALIVGDEILFEQICRENELKRTTDSMPAFFQRLHDDEREYLEPVLLFQNERLTCYHDPNDQQIYVHHRSRSLPGED